MWYMKNMGHLVVLQIFQTFSRSHKKVLHSLLSRRYIPKGTETIKGELNEGGLKVVYAYIGAYPRDGSFVWEQCKWKISDNENKVELYCGERVKVILTRE